MTHFFSDERVNSGRQVELDLAKCLAIFTVAFSLLFAAAFLFMSFADTVWAEDDDRDPLDKKKILMLKSSSSNGDSDETPVHADPDTFKKNYVLTLDQKESTIQKIEEVANSVDSNKSDLEKYFTLAVEGHKLVDGKYDYDFWSGGYNFDYYSHQWDSYGALNEKSVCVGIAIFYSHLCHAADLPCWFVRCEPTRLDHTINYIPDINGNAYYVDVTEDAFLMSEEANPYPILDKDFSHITKDCTDSTFNYIYGYDDDGKAELLASGIRAYHNKPYSDWFNEYALHKNTDKDFLQDHEYVERGSGLPRTDPDSYHASYHDYRSNFVDKTDVWFLDDFYENPAETKRKILDKKFDEDLMDVSEVKKSYDDLDFDVDSDTLDEETIAAIKEEILQDIKSVKYFPSSENGKVVAKSDMLEYGEDYTLEYTGNYDPATRTAEFVLKGIGEYTGEYPIKVRFKVAVVTKEPVPKKGLVYDGSRKKLVEPGEAENGKMQYALGTEKEPTEEFSSAIPTAADAGRYYVWYKSVGNEGYLDSDTQLMGKVASIAGMPLNIITENKTIKVGQSVKLSPKLEVDGIPVTFRFETYNKSIVSVDENGVVKGLKAGSATIYIWAVPDEPNSNYETHGFAMSTITVEDDNKTEPTAEPDDEGGSDDEGGFDDEGGSEGKTQTEDKSDSDNGSKTNGTKTGDDSNAIAWAATAMTALALLLALALYRRKQERE